MNSRGSSAGKWVIAAACLVGVGALAGFLYARLFLPRSMPVREPDRELLVTISDFADSLKNFTPRTDSARIKKLRHPSQLVELTYEYLHPDAERDVYVLCQVEVHPTGKSAHDAYRRIVNEAISPAPYAGLEYTAEQKLLRWGDAARLAHIEQRGKPRGYSFVCHEGERLIWIEAIGVRFADDEQFLDLAFSRVSALAEYQP